MLTHQKYILVILLNTFFFIFQSLHELQKRKNLCSSSDQGSWTCISHHILVISDLIRSELTFPSLSSESASLSVSGDFLLCFCFYPLTHQVSSIDVVSAKRGFSTLIQEKISSVLIPKQTFPCLTFFKWCFSCLYYQACHPKIDVSKCDVTEEGYSN